MEVTEILCKGFSGFMWLGKGQGREFFLNRVEFLSRPNSMYAFYFVRLYYAGGSFVVDISQFKET